MLGNLNSKISITLYLNLRYGCQIWFLSSSKFIKDKLERYKKALRIISFSDLRESSSHLFKEWKKVKDVVEIQICLFVHSFLKGKLPESFENTFQKCNTIHANPTRFISSDCLYMPRFESVTYGLNCITNICIH